MSRPGYSLGETKSGSSTSTCSTYYSSMSNTRRSEMRMSDAIFLSKQNLAKQGFPEWVATCGSNYQVYVEHLRNEGVYTVDFWERMDQADKEEILGEACSKAKKVKRHVRQIDMKLKYLAEKGVTIYDILDATLKTVATSSCV